MKKKGWITAIIILIVLIGLGIWFYFSTKNKNENTNYEASRTSSNSENPENELKNETTSSNEEEKKEEGKETTKEEENEQTETPPPQEEKEKAEYQEEQLATFSTKIYSKDSARQNNIQITCNLLNGTTVENGATFSFCTTVGKATTSKGYQKADIYDNNGKKEKGLRWWKLSSK